MSDSQPLRPATAWLIDTHVHIHSSFPLTSFIDGAFAAFRQASGTPAAIGALCITDAAGQHGFERLKRSRGAWEIEETAEAASFLVRRGVDVLAIIAGRQAATAERLEVLQLGSARNLPDGESVTRTLELARQAGGVGVVPWGFGKWTFGRGRRIRDLIARDDGALVLGDTGNRPRALRAHPTFRAARARGIPILPGSDPLPLASHAARAGSCGIRLACVPDLTRPAQQMVELLSVRAQPPTFCTRNSATRFAIDQLLIRVARGRADALRGDT